MAKESRLQETCVAWCEWQGLVWPELKHIYHIRNEGKRSVSEGARAKRMGLKRGMPDLHLPVARRGWHSLYIELKKPGEKPPDYQVKKMHELFELGNLVYCIDSHSDFEEVLTWYLGYDQGDSFWFVSDKFQILQPRRFKQAQLFGELEY